MYLAYAPGTRGLLPTFRLVRFALSPSAPRPRFWKLLIVACRFDPPEFAFPRFLGVSGCQTCENVLRKVRECVVKGAKMCCETCWIDLDSARILVRRNSLSTTGFIQETIVLEVARRASNIKRKIGTPRQNNSPVGLSVWL